METKVSIKKVSEQIPYRKSGIDCKKKSKETHHYHLDEVKYLTKQPHYMGPTG